jgi:hypothetical protein
LNVMELEELRFFDIIGSLMQEATMSESWVLFRGLFICIVY